MEWTQAIDWLYGLGLDKQKALTPYALCMYMRQGSIPGTGRPGRLIGSFVIFCQIFGPKSGPDGSGQLLGFICTKFQAKPSILDPFRTQFDVFGPDRNYGQPGFGLVLALDKPHRCWEA